VIPLVSVIIPTYGREQVLQETIASVLQQDYPHYEVIVVDQTRHHEPATQSYLQGLAATAKIRWFQVSWASLPGARNYGVRRSTGEIIVFLDDDVVLPAGFIAAHVQNFDRPEVGAVAGRIFDRMKLAEAEADLVIEDLPPEAMDPGLAWHHLNLVHTIKPQWVLTARGCNMSFRRILFDQHQLWFDERFQGSAVREESDFCLRIRSTGYQIWYDPTAHLVHLGEESGGCHDISTRSLEYQITFYHNNFLMALKNLTPQQFLHLASELYRCQVMGRPPCHKSGSPIRVLSRSIFYGIGFLSAVFTLFRSPWQDGQVYSQLDRLELSANPAQQDPAPLQLDPADTARIGSRI
jgi:glycosyltransferase involved in cell wall biosynthesis